MDTARYRALLAAAETGSLSRAAERLHYTPSGVSQLIDALERDLGFALLSRSRRGVELTHAGQRLLPIFRELLRQEEVLLQTADRLRGLETGTVRIGTYPSIGRIWLPRVIRDFQQKHPKIEILVVEGIWQELHEQLKQLKLDLAFLSDSQPVELEWIPLAEDPMLAILPMEHPLAGEAAYPLERCQQESFIMPAMGQDVDVTALLRRHGLTPEIRVVTMENPSVLAMIELGMGMSIMNELITENWQYQVAKLPLDPPESITLGAALPSVEEASPAAREFLREAVRACGGRKT